MGYNITIGNAYPCHSKDDDYLDAYWDVERVTLPEAPEFPNDEMTGKGNCRSPSYSAWSNFCKDANIYSVFYDESGRMRYGHPGTQLITKEDVEKVQLALEVYKEIATQEPGFEGFPVFDPLSHAWVTPDEGRYDATLARLIWLEFWMTWAFNNCETPAIRNT